MAALTALALGGCRDATQLVVVVDSDLLVGSELATVQVSASIEGGASAEHVFDVDEVGLPFSFGVTPAFGPEDRVFLRASAFAAEAETSAVTRHAATGFVEGRALLVELPLSRACAFQEIDCGDETCQDGGCVSAEIDPSELPEANPASNPTPIFDGPSPPRDAGMLDGGEGCVENDPCDTGDPCVPGRQRCSTDLPECEAQEPLSAGTACGAGRTCNEEGECE